MRLQKSVVALTLVIQVDIFASWQTFNVMGMWGWTKEEKGYEESSNLVQGFDMMTMCKMG